MRKFYGERKQAEEEAIAVQIAPFTYLRELMNGPFMRLTGKVAREIRRSDTGYRLCIDANNLTRIKQTISDEQVLEET